MCVFRVWEEAMTELGCIPLCGCGGGGWWCVSCRSDSLMGGYSHVWHHVWGDHAMRNPDCLRFGHGVEALCVRGDVSKISTLASSVKFQRSFTFHGNCCGTFLNFGLGSHHSSIIACLHMSNLALWGCHGLCCLVGVLCVCLPTMPQCVIKL